ncbi:MAG: MoaD/ThiS family protein [Acidobacteriota bacterium]|nr:MoaD/ThiS family protein [Acidobacteriota bacterium]
MKVQVRFFASLVDRVGAVTVTVELDDGADVARLWSELERRHPGLSAMDYRPMVACDMEYAAWDTKLDGIREVAFLPPVSGG